MIKKKVIKNKMGFLIPEMMIAFSLMTLFLISILTLSSSMQSLHDQAVKSLMHMKTTTFDLDNYLTYGYLASTTALTKIPYGNDSTEIYAEPFSVLVSDYQTAWGADSCNPRIDFDPAKVHVYKSSLSLPSGNVGTDIEVRNGIAYLSTDSATVSVPDLYIIDTRNPSSPYIMSPLNTGPGLSALKVAGHYIYTANAGTTNQLQVIDISNRSAPVLISKLRLPLPLASSTAPFASTIFYNKNKIYLGTQKWDGSEFAVIDVSNPYAPIYLGGYKTDTLVEDIYVRDGFAYLANADQSQMRILNVHDPTYIFQVASFSPSGWETQEGKTVSYFEGKYSLGRTTGGFNVLTNYEIFNFSTTSPITTGNYHDIPGGVYGVISRPPYVYLITHSVGHEFQVWDGALSHQVFNMSLGFQPQGFSCDGSNFYFTTGDQNGLAILTTQ